MPRFLHRWYAFVAGYFWTPCPRCGRWFGGHENGGGADYILDDRGWVTCSDCPGDRTCIDGVWHDGLFFRGQEGDIVGIKYL